MKRNTRVCLVYTPYSLLVYLLYSSLDEIQNTFFILGNNMPKTIASQLKYCYVLPTPPMFLRHWLFLWIYYRIIKLFYLPHINSGTNLYCQDHLTPSAIIVGKCKYTMIEDSPYICHNYWNGPIYITDLLSHKRRNYRLLKYLFGPIYKNRFANNNYCKAILMTKEDNTDYIKPKEHIIVNLKHEWDNSSDAKINHIKRTFNLDESDICCLKDRTEILFTQPLTDMSGISVEDQESIYIKMARNYSPNNLIIKVHPRDNVNYEKILPEYKIFKKQVPSQLLDLIGVHYSKAITAFSTAVSDFTYPIEIDWYGTEVSDKIKACVKMPEKARKCKLD